MNASKGKTKEAFVKLVELYDFEEGEDSVEK